MKFWILILLASVWTISTSNYEQDHNFVNAFNAVVCCLALVGYIVAILFIK